MSDWERGRKTCTQGRDQRSSALPGHNQAQNEEPDEMGTQTTGEVVPTCAESTNSEQSPQMPVMNTTAVPRVDAPYSSGIKSQTRKKDPSVLTALHSMEQISTGFLISTFILSEL